jgi:hypothetical protein
MSRSPRIPRPLSVSLVLMLFVSCANPLGMCGCDPLLPSAVVHGRVTGPDGGAAAGARVVTEWGQQCAEPFIPAGTASTGTDGRYGMHVSVPGGNLPAVCLRAFAAPGATGTLRVSDTVTFDVGFPGGGVVDSAEVNLVLRAP